MPSYRRILIIKPSSLGDIVHALPTLAAIRDAFPDAHIAWLVKKQWAGLLERVEGLDRIWPVGPGLRGWLSHVPALRAVGFDLVVDLQGLLRSGILARLIGCATRVGFANAREGSRLLYTHRVAVPTPDMHAVDRYLLVAGAVGAGLPPEQRPAFRFRIPEGDRQRVIKLLDRHGVPSSRSWVAINPSARWPTKRWPPACFAAVADRLSQMGQAPVVLIGGPEDRVTTRSVRALMRSEAIDLAGETEPGLLPALLQSAAVLLTNDSGPMHVAAAVGTPVVALFGPTSPLRTGPYGPSHQVLTSGIACSPCFSRTCRHPAQLECLVSIAPDQVAQAVQEQLRGSQFARLNIESGIPSR